jgi:hypothetical protein
MADPVVELWALDEADPWRVVIAVAERERLAHNWPRTARRPSHICVLRRRGGRSPS